MNDTKTKKTALISAVDILARQEQSERRLTEKLARKGYDVAEIAAAIDTLKEKHYLNDDDACKRQFDYLYNDSRSSVKQICAKLMQRGFPISLVNSVIPRDIFEREKLAALKALRLKYKPSADKQKMMASLYRSGYDSAAIRSAVAEFLQEE